MDKTTNIVSVTEIYTFFKVAFLVKQAKIVFHNSILNVCCYNQYAQSWEFTLKKGLQNRQFEERICAFAFY